MSSDKGPTIIEINDRFRARWDNSNYVLEQFKAGGEKVKLGFQDNKEVETKDKWVFVGYYPSGSLAPMLRACIDREMVDQGRIDLKDYLEKYKALRGEYQEILERIFGPLQKPEVEPDDQQADDEKDNG